MLLSLIVPCFNEQAALPAFYAKTSSVLSQMDCEYELLFVNDGSNDGTVTVVKDLAQNDQRVFYLSFSRNFGKEAAIYAGLCNAHGDLVAILEQICRIPLLCFQRC